MVTAWGEKGTREYAILNRIGSRNFTFYDFAYEIWMKDQSLEGRQTRHAPTWLNEISG